MTFSIADLEQILLSVEHFRSSLLDLEKENKNYKADADRLEQLAYIQEELKAEITEKRCIKREY